MEKGKKTNSEFIIDALHAGQDLRSPEITERVSEKSGKKMKIQDIASILAKLSNSDKCDLGFFVQKKKTNKGYAYSLVPEAFNLSSEALYDLTRKTGKNRYTLDQAISDFPELKKYVKSSRLKTGAVKKTTKRGRKPSSVSSQKAALSSSGRSAKPSHELSDQELKVLVAHFLEELADQGGLNINVNLNVRFSGIGWD